FGVEDDHHEEQVEGGGNGESEEEDDEEKGGDEKDGYSDEKGDEIDNEIEQDPIKTVFVYVVGRYLDHWIGEPTMFIATERPNTSFFNFDIKLFPILL
ncbi:hypothetical protein HDU76_012192, partial [Blyttiomyces sp. JEL0837]